MSGNNNFKTVKRPDWIIPAAKSPTGRNSEMLDSSEYDYIEEEKSSENEDDSNISPQDIIEEEDSGNF